MSARAKVSTVAHASYDWILSLAADISSDIGTVAVDSTLIIVLRCCFIGSACGTNIPTGPSISSLRQTVDTPC